MSVTIGKKKSSSLEVKHGDDDIKIRGFIADECAIIKSMDEGLFNFGPFFAMSRNIGYIPGIQLRKRQGCPLLFLRSIPLLTFLA